jgi:nucleoid-associated protein YgaU
MSATRPARPAAAAVSLRLTRRGRLTLVLLLVALAFAVVSMGQAAVQAVGPDASDAAPVGSTYVVQPGETLWSIAEQVDADSDPRETVARIVAMNDLAGAGVVVGQELVLPA